MRKVLFYCDRRGIEITGMINQLATINFDSASPDLTEVNYGADLCDDCYKTVDDAILSEIQVGKQLRQISAARERKLTQKDGPKVTKRMSPGTKKPLDMGKVHALRNAGWSWDKIGEEFGVSGVTVAKRVSEEESEKQEVANNE